MMPAEPEGAPAAQLLKERVKALPTQPGVYLFLDSDGVVLYVGKAQDLRARVRSYFASGGDGRWRLQFLVPRIRDVDVVVTANVKEALLLENLLIKKHRPRFNVRLRDDKSYLGLRLDSREKFPRFTEVRRFRRDGAEYFGPYTSSGSLRETLSSVQKIFPLRTCSNASFKSYQRKGRPCLEHSLGRCAAPCCGEIEAAAYQELVVGTVRLLKGRGRELLDDLDAQMREAAAGERFEEAQRLRDRIRAIESTVERQSMISARFSDRDAFGLAREGAHLEIQLLHVRQGTLLGGRTHSFRNVRIDDARALDSFLTQFYAGDRDLPQEVLLPLAVEGKEALEALWRETAERPPQILVPQRGERRKLVDLACQNAEVALAEHARRERGLELALEEIRELLRLTGTPARIECYDTSHLQGSMHVGSRVVFTAGRPDKRGYRRYRLREAPPGDDYAAMREILARRLGKLDRDPAPDLILVDGGKGQLNVVRALLGDLDEREIAVAALAKARDEGAPSPRVLRHGGAKREKLFLAGVKDPLQPPADSAALLLLQRIRDESHRFAIRYHRELRSRLGLRSILEELPGIGPAKRRSLLRVLGSLERVKQASAEELASVPKLTRADAERIARFFGS